MSDAVEALARADRHCDLEGLPVASGFARGLDDRLVSGRISAEDAVQMLIAFHRERTKAPDSRG
ncbi:hypothetical protein [Panacagrimonas sp.]|uniref:hypothetical protein n=1 Tax=Panacagrimonas sp. TaxID=2480088 RepID=UPI003B51CA2E